MGHGLLQHNEYVYKSGVPTLFLANFGEGDTSMSTTTLQSVLPQHLWIVTAEVGINGNGALIALQLHATVSLYCVNIGVHVLLISFV